LYFEGTSFSNEKKVLLVVYGVKKTGEPMLKTGEVRMRGERLFCPCNEKK
jgi:hypothetical protein